jgi:hypothetical protein
LVADQPDGVAQPKPGNRIVTTSLDVSRTLSGFQMAGASGKP